MRKEVARYRAEAERWNLSGSAWWLLDLRDDPDHLICSEEAADLFGLDSASAAHRFDAIFPAGAEAAQPLFGENCKQCSFIDLEQLSVESDTAQLTFKWLNPLNNGYLLFSNQIRVIERSAQGRPEILYGVIEDVTAGSASTFESLFNETFDEMAGQFGFGYRFIVDLDNLLIMPDRAMAHLHGAGWVAGQWYPFSGIYDWTPQEYLARVKEDTDSYRREINRAGFAEINAHHPHIHAQTGRLHWYNIRRKSVALNQGNFSIGFAVDVTDYHYQQEQLKEQLTRQDILSSNGEIAQWQYDCETGTLLYDELYCEWLGIGLKPDEPCGMDQVMSTMTEEQQQSFLLDVQRGMDLLLTQRTTDEYVWDHYVWDRVVRAIAKRTQLNGREVVLGYSIDVTDMVRAKLEAQKLHQRLMSLAETAQIGIFDHDLISDSFECNSAFREIYDLPHKQYPKITREHIESRWDPKHAKAYRRIRDAALRGESSQAQERILTLPDGSIRHVSVAVNGEYLADSLVRISGSVIDHTDELLKQAELEDMVCEREEMLRKQQQMFAIIGHELRTPVAAVRMLLADQELPLNEKLLKVGDISDGLLNVLDDLRLISEPGRDQGGENKVVNPERIVGGAVASLKQVLADRSIVAHQSIEAAAIPLVIPVQSLRQVVTNLVKNSALHSEGANIYISLEYSETPGSVLLATLRVEDDGIGIPADERRRLFEAFERGKSKQDGSGLGLYIVRTLATKMDGAVSCTASRYGGACFSVSFPVVRSALAPLSVELESEVSLDGMKILFAEDEATLRLLTDRMLTKRGGVVTCCENGELALEAFKKGKYDLLLTDMMMPKLDGVGLIEAVREISADIPIIAVTAAVLGSESNRLIEAGANEVVAKPITATVLQKTLAQLDML